MKHFATERWADLVRSTISDNDAKEMQKHLATGCESCNAEFQSWQRIASIASTEKQYEPSPDALHQAMAQLSVQSALPEMSTVQQIAALVMDSLKTPVALGVRSGQATARQLLYQQGSCVIDVRVELKPNSNKLSIIGQVQDSTMVESDFKKVSVCVLSGNHLVMHTTTNNTGEFHLECQAVEKLSLQVGLEGKSIVLPVPDLSVSTQIKRA